MQRFLQRFVLLVAGTLSGFDRLVFKGRLCPLYWPEGMNRLLRANHVLHKEFKQYAKEVTARVVETSGVPQAKAQGRYRYLNSSKIDKEQPPGSSPRNGVARRAWSASWAASSRAGPSTGRPTATAAAPSAASRASACTCTTTTSTRPLAGSTSACRPGSPSRSRSA